jgi:hypothetical protein
MHCVQLECIVCNWNGRILANFTEFSNFLKTGRIGHLRFFYSAQIFEPWTEHEEPGA